MSDSTSPVLELRDLVKAFPVRTPLLRRIKGYVRAVDGASLTVDAGETIGLVGESGSGKTTFGRLAMRLIEPTAGSIVLDGRDITKLDGSDLRKSRRDIQMV